MMNKFTTGILIGSAAAVAGISYLVQDQRTCRRVMKKGKKAAVKAEEIIDDMMDDLMDK